MKKPASAATNKPKTAAKVSQTGRRNGRRWRPIMAGASISVSYKNNGRLFFAVTETFGETFGSHSGLCTLQNVWSSPGASRETASPLGIEPGPRPSCPADPRGRCHPTEYASRAHRGIDSGRCCQDTPSGSAEDYCGRGLTGGLPAVAAGCEWSS